MRYPKRSFRAAFIPLIAALMFITILPFCAFAESVQWELTLPENLKTVRKYTFQGDMSLSSVYVGDGVTSIGESAFADSSVKDIRLPAGLASVAGDAFRNVPHVEIHGSADESLFAGMDNVSISGETLNISDNTACVDIAACQTVRRLFNPAMTGLWRFSVSGCDACEIRTINGDLLKEFTAGENCDLTADYELETMDPVIFRLTNNSDALSTAAITFTQPYTIRILTGTAVAEYKDSDGSMINDVFTETRLPLDQRMPNEYYIPILVVETEEGITVRYNIDMFVDDVLIKNWTGRVGEKADTEQAILYPAPWEAAKYHGFEAGDHTIRFNANGLVREFELSLTGAYDHQKLDLDTHSVFVMPGARAIAEFTAPQAGDYTFRSDNPVKTPLRCALTVDGAETAAVLSDDPSARDIDFSVTLDQGQTAVLELWYTLPEDGSKPYYGVVPITINEPYSEGVAPSPIAVRRAVVIGQTYENSNKEYGLTVLSGCRKDLEEMAAFLTGLKGTPFSVSQYVNLSKEEILSAIARDFAGATENNISLFYYSGHGAGGTGSLIGTDNEMLAPAELRAALDRIPGQKIIILDSCYSGHLISRDEDAPAEAADRAAMEKFINAFRLQSRALDGFDEYYILTGSSMYETSIGYYEYTSLFTRVFLEAFMEPSADVNGDGKFTLAELCDYCRREVLDTMVGQTVCAYPDHSDQVLFIP